MELNKAYDEIFTSKNLHENLNKINAVFKGNELVDEVVNFIAKDKKRAICAPLNKE
jgi:acyl-[acyl carrier protein]--UDP-N-acetylglucosamine O-acyltransferase